MGNAAQDRRSDSTGPFAWRSSVTAPADANRKSSGRWRSPYSTGRRGRLMTGNSVTVKKSFNWRVIF